MLLAPKWGIVDLRFANCWCTRAFGRGHKKSRTRHQAGAAIRCAEGCSSEAQRAARVRPARPRHRAAWGCLAAPFPRQEAPQLVHGDGPLLGDQPQHQALRIALEPANHPFVLGRLKTSSERTAEPSENFHVNHSLSFESIRMREIERATSHVAQVESSSEMRFS